DSPSRIVWKMGAGGGRRARALSTAPRTCSSAVYGGVLFLSHNRVGRPLACPQPRPPPLDRGWTLPGSSVPHEGHLQLRGRRLCRAGRTGRSDTPLERLDPSRQIGSSGARTMSAISGVHVRAHTPSVLLEQCRRERFLLALFAVSSGMGRLVQRGVGAQRPDA